MNHPLTSDERAVLVKMLNEHGYRQVLTAIADHAKLCGDTLLSTYGRCRTVERWDVTAHMVNQWSLHPCLTHCSVPTWDQVTA